MNKLATLCLFGLAYLFTTGHSCSYNRYQIELVPDGPELERTLTCSREGDPEGPEGKAPEVDPAELTRIAALYRERVSPPGGRQALQHPWVQSLPRGLQSLPGASGSPSS